MKKLFKTAVLVSVCFLLYYANAFADVPKTVSLQGRLTTNTGVPITSTKTFSFEIYSSETATNPIKTFSNQSIYVSNGMYSAVLDLSSLTNEQLNNSLYVQIKIGNSDIGNRIPLTASPYALTVKDGAITEVKISSDAVTNSKIKNNAVTADKIQNSAVTSVKLASSAVTKEKIAATGSGTYLVQSGNTLKWENLSGAGTLPAIGTNGQYLAVNNGSASWNPVGNGLVAVSSTVYVKYPLPVAFPTLNNNSGRFLTTNGSALQWSSILTLPTIGTNGQYLAVNNGSASWNPVGNGLVAVSSTVYVKYPLPVAFPAINTPGTSGKFLTTNGSALQWSDISGTLPSTSNNNTNRDYYLAVKGQGNSSWQAFSTADFKVESNELKLNNPLTSLAQTINGLKTFTDGIEIGNNLGKITLEGNSVEVSTGLKVNGTIVATGSVLQGADLAEIYPSAEILNPGDVVVISETRDEYIEKSRKAEDTKVAGVVSTKPAIVLNSEAKGYQLALVGKVPVNVTNEGGSIKRGDLLVTSSTGGYAMKAPENPKPGTIIGKALENYTGSRGKILALVNLQ